jgi:hypothetical protein
LKTSAPCPNCKNKITLSDFEDFSTPFTMKCPHCKSKLKESKVTGFLVISFIIALPLFYFLASEVKILLSNIIPVISKVPTSVVFLGTLYPVFTFYDRVVGLIVFNKGNLAIKKRQ